MNQISRLAFAAVKGLGVSVALTIMMSTADAQSAGVFAGKTVQLIIGFGPASGYTLWGRAVARHIGKHLPGNPAVVAQNMPGAGSFVAANNIYNVAPKDGTAMGLIAGPAALGPLNGAKGARFDSTKFSWLGTPTTETSVCIANSSAAVHSAEDLFAKQLIVGDTGAGTITHSFPQALSALAGMKFKAIAGFQSSGDVFLAMERGEVDGICEHLSGVIDKRPDWIASGKVRVLFQTGAKPNLGLTGVPSLVDLVRNQEDRTAVSYLAASDAIGRPFVAPPAMAPDRVQMLRDAFDATMKDADFLAEARNQGLEVQPRNGAELAALINQLYATPKPIVEKVGKLLQ